MRDDIPKGFIVPRKVSVAYTESKGSQRSINSVLKSNLVVVEMDYRRAMVGRIPWTIPSILAL